MKKKDIKALVSDCINPRKLCRFYFSYDDNYFYYFPLLAGDKLFLGLEEDDFMTDGYEIRRFKDVIKAEVKDDLCAKILKAEGIIDRIETPEINIENWQTVFESLAEMQINIIVEKELLPEDDNAFVIGRIEKVNNSSVCVRHFDADGMWQEKPYKIPYRDITSVTFHSRYIDVFSKYVSVKPKYQYRITKYDPKNRIDGKYIKDEWTSYSDINQPFSGTVLTLEDYLATEEGYIQCMMELLSISGIEELCIEALELHDKIAKKRWKNQRVLNGPEIKDFMRDCLRGRCWARLTANRFFVHFGYEYYMYVGCEKPIEIVAPIAEKNHLFCEDFISPYHRRLE